METPTPTPWTASSVPSCRQVLSRMGRDANPGHVKAARLRESGIEWTIALEKAKVPDTDLTRMSVRRIIRESGSKAKAKSDDAALRARCKDLKARDVALELAVELRAKRKDLKARETALELARRDLKSPLKRG